MAARSSDDDLPAWVIYDSFNSGNNDGKSPDYQNDDQTSGDEALAMAIAASLEVTNNSIQAMRNLSEVTTEVVLTESQQDAMRRYREALARMESSSSASKSAATQSAPKSVQQRSMPKTDDQQYREKIMEEQNREYAETVERDMLWLARQKENKIQKARQQLENSIIAADTTRRALEHHKNVEDDIRRKCAAPVYEFPITDATPKEDIFLITFRTPTIARTGSFAINRKEKMGVVLQLAHHETQHAGDLILSLPPNKLIDDMNLTLMESGFTSRTLVVIGKGR